MKSDIFAGCVGAGCVTRGETHVTVGRTPRASEVESDSRDETGEPLCRLERLPATSSAHLNRGSLIMTGARKLTWSMS
jgi:hypothetical protein